MTRLQYLSAVVIAFAMFLVAYSLGRATMFRDMVNLIGEMFRRSQ